MIPSLRTRAACRATALALAASLASGAASAMTVAYQCIGYRPLTAEFTPREAQVHFEGKNWTLARVRDAREATYVNGHAGIRVVTKQRELTLHTGKETLECKLQSDALKPESLGMTPTAPPSTPSGAH